MLSGMVAALAGGRAGEARGRAARKLRQEPPLDRFADRIERDRLSDDAARAAFERELGKGIAAAVGDDQDRGAAEPLGKAAGSTSWRPCRSELPSSTTSGASVTAVGASSSDANAWVL